MSDLPILRTSERRAFLRCPRQWFWAYRQGLVSSRKSIALWFGTGVHLAFAHYYDLGTKRNLDFVDVWRAYCEEDEFSRAVALDKSGTEKAEYVDAKELGTHLLTEYHNYWAGDKHWDVIATEQDFQIKIPDHYNGNVPLGIFASTFDGVYRDKNDGHIKLMEHKTAKAIDVKYLSMDSQGGSYAAIASFILRHKGILSKKEYIKEITYNFIRKAKMDERKQDAQGYYLNQNGSRSARQPAPVFVREPVRRTRKAQANQIRRIADDMIAMNAVKSKAIPILKNVTRDCAWDCDFFEMCQLHDEDSDWREYKKSMYSVVDPYANHRKAAI